MERKYIAAVREFWNKAAAKGQVTIEELHNQVQLIHGVSSRKHTGFTHDVVEEQKQSSSYFLNNLWRFHCLNVDCSTDSVNPLILLQYKNKKESLAFRSST